jgi:hypothetical protein
MEIVENLDQWRQSFRSGWLAHYEQTGAADFKQYVRPRNRQAPAGPGVELSRSRLLFITTAGAYLPASQPPFDAASILGDYSLRTFPTATPFDQIAYAHTHYDHAAVDADPQVLMPLRHLEEMVTAGQIGALTPTAISFSGYQPDVARVVNELIPPIVDMARKEAAHAALLVPA